MPCPPSTYRITGVSPSRHAAPRDFAGALDAAGTAETDNAVVTAGDLSIDLGAMIVERSGGQVHLTRTEWSILDLLVRNRGRLVSRRQLLHHIWGPSERKETSYLRVYIAQLRQKLEKDPAHPQHLITEAGMGYRFRA